MNSNLSCTLSFSDSFPLESWLGSRQPAVFLLVL